MNTRLKVINLGLPKSGTTTLGRALKMAGLKTADYRIRPHQTDDSAIHDAFVGDLMYRGYFHTGDPLAHLGEFDGFSEISTLRAGHSLWPQMDFGLIRALRKHHPDTRFLASKRDAFAMSQSMLAWSDLGIERLPEGAIPGLPAGYGETTKERVQWIESHYENLRQLFDNDSIFMEYDVTDPQAAQKISAHIGRDLPWWGKINRSRTTIRTVS
ncbi:MAG: hypothetical protein Q9M48_12745 [Rhodobacterales bacterium]|nr:hypothetical protein [Rhodobacterales bacterium]